MAFAIPWDETDPAGTVAADTIDTEIQDTKKAVRERITDLFPGWTDDAEDPKIVPSWILRKTDVRVGLASGTVEAVTWTTEDRDTAAFIVVPATLVTIPAGLGGLYFLDATISWAINATDRRQIEIFINGVSSALEKSLAVASVSSHSRLTKVMLLVPTDTVEIRVAQVSGVALDYGDVGANNLQNYFTGVKIGG